MANDRSELERLLSQSDAPKRRAFTAREILRSLPAFSAALTKNRLWSDFGHFTIMRLALAFTVFARFTDDSSSQAAKHAFEALSANRHVNFDERFVEALLEAAALGFGGDSKPEDLAERLARLRERAATHFELASFQHALPKELAPANRMLAMPLWDPEAEAANREMAESFSDNLLKHHLFGRFWSVWYRGFLNGRPLDWGLQREVALIPSSDWEKGAEHVAAEIEKIEAEHLRDASAIAEVVWFDEAARRFDVRPIDIRREDVVRLALERVEDSLEDALALGRGQHVREERVETFVLRRVLRKYRDDPQRIEMDFLEMAGLIARQVESREYPRNDPALDTLASALLTGASEIAATHPEVRETRERLDGQAEPPEITPEQQEQIAGALPTLRAISTGRLGEGFEEDIRELVNDALLPVPDHAPRLPPAGIRPRRPRKSVLRRLAFRVATIATSLGDVIHRVEGSAPIKAGKIVGAVAAVVTILLTLL